MPLLFNEDISINMFILRSVIFVILVHFSVTSVPKNHYPVRPTNQRHEGNHFWLKTTFPLAKTFGYFQHGPPTQNRGRDKICMPGTSPDQVLPRGRQAWTTKLSRKRRTKSRICYYSNSTATFQLLLIAGGVAQNPGPETEKAEALRPRRTPAPVCPQCEKTVRCNQKRLQCNICFNTTHASCVQLSYLKHLGSAKAVEWTCQECTISVFPFFCEDVSDAHEAVCNNTTDVEFEDPHLDALKRNSKNLSQLSVVHINTQSMVSTFDHLLIAIERYSFDIISMSETWLKNKSSSPTRHYSRLYSCIIAEIRSRGEVLEYISRSRLNSNDALTLRKDILPLNICG